MSVYKIPMIVLATAAALITGALLFAEALVPLSGTAVGRSPSFYVRPIFVQHTAAMFPRPLSRSPLFFGTGGSSSGSDDDTSPETELTDDFTKSAMPASDNTASYSLNPSDANLLQNLSKDEKSLLSAGALVLLDIAFRRLFQRMQISFPSSLGGMGALLLTLLFTGGFGRKIYNILQPGAALLAKWLPVFFVPSLITLPLVGGVGSSVEVNTKLMKTCSL
jgi:hypothetical protein